MILKNAKIMNFDFKLQRADILVENEKISRIAENIDGESIDFSGRLILPGFIDIHIHACAGGDFAHAKEESLETMSCFLASNGVTSFCPASMTVPEEQLAPSFKAVAAYMGKETGAYIHGINMEGPFISVEGKGAQPEEYIRKPDMAEFNRLNKLCKISLVDVAPEAEGAFDFAREASKTCRVSAAHTFAPYEQAAECFENGFSHVTHLLNGMAPIINRSPGVATAALDNENVTAELICDGKHIYPALLRLAFRLLGENRSVVVSDAMKAAGLGDGEYELGGQTVFVKNGRATLADGTFAASTSNMFEEFKNIISYNIPFRQAVKSCTINPARVIGEDKKTGSIETGKTADLLVLSEDLQHIEAVFIKGRRFNSGK